MMTRTHAGTRRTDRAMLAAVVLSVCVHAAGLLVLTKPPSNPPPTTDVVGESDEVVLGLDLGLDLAMTDPPPAPPLPPEPIAEPIDEPEPAKPEPEAAPEPLLPPVPTVAELPEPDAPVAKTPIELPTPKPSFAISLEAPPAAPPAAHAPPKHSTPEPPSTPPPEARPIAAFAGVKADRAKRVVYAVDVSGVMVGSLPFVLEELKRCVNRLGPDQEFQVILFRDPTPASGTPAPADNAPSQGASGHDPAFDGDQAPSASTLPPLEDLYSSALWLGQTSGSAKPAAPTLFPVDTDSRKQLATLVSDLQSDGASNPLTGLRLALSMKPDVVFLLTRGIRRSGTSWGPGERQVMLALDEANPKDESGRRATTIRTIQFVGKDPSGLMDRIAKEHGGGSSTVLTVAELKAAAKPGKR